MNSYHIFLEKDGRHRDNVKEVPGDKEVTKEGEYKQQEAEETKNENDR